MLWALPGNMSLDRRLFPFGVGIIATGIGFGLYAAETAVLLGLSGFFLTKVVQSTIWTVTGDSRR
jgi:hypothetical protein